MIRIFNQYVSTKSLMLILLEALLISCSFVLAARLRFWNDPAGYELNIVYPDFALRCLICWFLLQACFYLNHVYDPQVAATLVEQMMRLIESVGAACLLLGVLYFVVPQLLIGRGILLTAVALVLISSALTRMALDSVWHTHAAKSNVLLLGTGEMAMTVAREINRRGDLNMRLAGFVHESATGADATLLGLPVLGNIQNLEPIIREKGINRLIVALQDQRGTMPVRELVKLRVQGVWIEDAHSAISALTGRVWLDTVRPSWFVFSEDFTGRA